MMPRKQLIYKKMTLFNLRVEQNHIALFADGIFRKTFTEHRSFALRLFFGRFILNDVPMLDEDSVLNAQNICDDPIHGSTETAESPVNDHKVTLGYNRSWLVP